jgi:hypothetical protein
MKLACACAVIALAVGCRTPPTLPPVDLAQPGWQVKQGQAVWRPSASGPELTGELVWASAPDGRFLLQFLKTPITMVEARGSKEDWRISFPAQGRTFTGSRGRSPSQRLGWLYLARALQGERLSEDWIFTKGEDRWKLANARTGEMIEGYLAR